jgi:hypothetical protein
MLYKTNGIQLFACVNGEWIHAPAERKVKVIVSQQFDGEWLYTETDENDTLAELDIELYNYDHYDFDEEPTREFIPIFSSELLEEIND